MNLFDSEPRNILPYDGETIYYGKVLDRPTADTCFDRLIENIEWRHDEVMMFGRKITTARETAWYGDKPYRYVYSGIGRVALPWTQEIRKLKELAEKICGEPFNSCLLNLYHDGSQGMAWHSDNESTLEPGAAIASFSFGAERKFSLKHNDSKQSVSVVLEHGGLLVMRGSTQDYWKHCLPKTKKVTRPRINLTFRRMKPTVVCLG
ncbi:DNA methylase (plasmid) [Fulvitalea axinellae]|uniref:DNA methylase n=1 Tax=Fulvitalea axinellae TaxID=1182444 RepID=A0AAU9CWX1_9BACT|nr:DNA methylase [Fulvitalea axinellae]